MPWCQSSMGISELSIYLLALGEGWEGGGGQGLRETAGLVSQKNDPRESHEVCTRTAGPFLRLPALKSSSSHLHAQAPDSLLPAAETHGPPQEQPVRGAARGRQELSAPAGAGGRQQEGSCGAAVPASTLSPSLLDRGGRSSAPDESAP